MNLSLLPSLTRSLAVVSLTTSIFTVQAARLSTDLIYSSGAGAYQTDPSLSSSLNRQSISQVTLIAGRPDFSLPFVRGMVTDGYSFIRFAETEITTQQLSILGDYFIHRVSMAEIVNPAGQTDFNLLARAIQFAVTRSPVVTFSLGGDSRGNNSICAVMSRYPQTAFVVAPTDGYIRPDSEPACESANILRVTALNEQQDDLAHFASEGATIRLAAPGVRIPTVGAGGIPRSMTGTTAAVTVAAAALADFSTQTFDELQGDFLIDQFLAERTIELPQLQGRVEGARALQTFSPNK